MSLMSFYNNDQYKFSMQQAVLELYPDATVQYRFVNRGKQRFNEEFVRALKDNINRMADLQPDKLTTEWFKRLAFIKPWYVQYLKNYRYNPDEIYLALTPDNDLDLRIKGFWHSAILWEVPLLALISELYFFLIDTKWSLDDQNDKINSKLRVLDNLPAFADFGTRRRRSAEHHLWVAKVLKSSGSYVGTSNVEIAFKTGVKPIGTMAHEFVQGSSVLGGLRHANRYALDAWVKVYRGNLGIALSDTYGIEPFFEDFDLLLSKLYDGIRHDSGDPFVFMERAIQHYACMGIDPMSKTLVFSDSLNPEKALKIAEACKGRIKCSFGIGTNLTNDVTNSPPLNIVIKMWSLNTFPTVKLSEDPSKAVGTPDAIANALWVFSPKRQIE